MIYLYVKQHSITKLKYFGKTTSSNPFKYNGSGKYWTKHIKKHKPKHIQTLEIWGFDNQELCTKFALKFSKDNNIVFSKEWANLCEENGISGGNLRLGMNHTKEAKEKISLANKGRKHTTEHIIAAANGRRGFKHTDEYKKNVSIFHRNKIVSKETRQKMSDSAKIKIFSNEHRKNISDKSKLFKHTDESKMKISIANKNRILTKHKCPHCNKITDMGNLKRWHLDNCRSFAV